MNSSELNQLEKIEGLLDEAIKIVASGRVQEGITMVGFQKNKLNNLIKASRESPDEAVN